MRTESFSAFFLEMLNGGAITPETWWLVLLTIYLDKETRRRGLRWYQWFHLPPSMDLILAVFVCDVGVQVRSLTIWVWRRFGGAGEFSAFETGLLIFGGALIVMGSLCKVRALTAPDSGNGHWLRAMGATAGILALMFVLR